MKFRITVCRTENRNHDFEVEEECRKEAEGKALGRRRMP